MRLEIAATELDWLSLFKIVDPYGTFKFYKRGVYSDPRAIPLGIDDLPDLGVSKIGIMVHENSYVIDKLNDFRMRPQTVKGADAYIVDAFLNRDVVTFYPGGVFGDNFFIMGELTSQSELGRGVIKSFAKAMRKWKRDTGIYFGEDCVARMQDRFFTFDYRNQKWKFFND